MIYPATISNLVAEQFPSFYQEEGPVFVEFVQAYYEWLEQEGNALFYARRLPELSDVDQTLEEFLIHFKNTYLQGVQFETLADKRLSIKKIIDLYRAKGNPRALKLLFQLVYKEDIDLYFPGDDVLKSSDGIWVKPVYLEVTETYRNKEYLGKLVKGAISGATAFVDRIVKRQVNGRYVTVFYITNLSNDFKTGERLIVNNNIEDVPIVIGSLSGLVIDEGGYGFTVGQILNLTSTFGKYGKAKVLETADVTGIVTFKLLEGGWGFTNNSEIIISNTVLYLSNINSTALTNTYPIPKFSKVTITNPSNLALNVTANVFAYSNTANLYLNTVVGSFIKGETVSSGDNNANAYVRSVTTNSSVVALNVSNVFSFYFKNGLSVRGLTSNAIGTLFSTDIDIGIHKLSAGSITAGHTVLTTVSGNAVIAAATTGINANISIKSLSGTETVPIFTDYISDNNFFNSAYLTIGLNASNYGFPKFPTANSSTILIDALQYSVKELSEITAIRTVNPGKLYNKAPYVEIYERAVATKKKQDYILTIDTIDGGFTVGEIINQTVPLSGLVSVGVSGIIYANSDPGEFTYSELVFQNDGVSNVATGSVYQINTGELLVNVYSGTFTTDYEISGLSSTANATVDTVTLGGVTSQAIGKITFANDSVIYAKREGIIQDFVTNINVVGELSGAMANVTGVYAANSLFSGDNAIVAANVISSNGSITKLLVADSGLGYSNAENLITFSSLDGEKTGTVIPIIAKQGYGSGYYSTTRGFLSADKYIQDGEYYQEFSYEIQASRDLTKYAQMVRDVTHVAGTKFFGAVIKKTTATNKTTINNSNTGPIVG